VPDEQLSDPRFWSIAELNDYVNECNKDLAVKTEFKQKNRITLVADEQTYFDLPSDCYKVLRVTYDDDKLYPITMRELDTYDENWRDTTQTEPERYFLDNLAPGKLGVWPRTTTSGTTFDFDTEYGVMVRLTEDSTDATFDQETGAVTNITNTGDYEFNQEYGVVVRVATTDDNLKVDYVAIPDDLTVDTDEPEMNKNFHIAYVYFVCKEALLKHGDQRDTQKAMLYEQKYMRKMQEAAQLYRFDKTPDRVWRMKARKVSRGFGPRLPSNYPRGS
jgi:hypothetical protein